VINVIKCFENRKYILVVIGLTALLGLTVLLLEGITASADTSGPLLTNLFPDAESGPSPEISAAVYDPDGINPLSTFFKLDGKPRVGVKISLNNNATVGKIVYTSPELINGPHTVFISIMDNLGNISSISWTFTVTGSQSQPQPEIIDESPSEPENTQGPVNNPGQVNNLGPVISYPEEEANPGKILTVRYPRNTELRIKAEDPQQLSLLSDTAKVSIRKANDGNGEYADLVYSFVYQTSLEGSENGSEATDYSRGFFKFTLGERPDGAYIVRAEIQNELGTASQHEVLFVIRDKAANTSCTTCHYKKPYDHSTRNCDGCHKIIGDSGQKDCRICHDPWPHGPEVFINPQPSVPTLCTDCHLASDVGREANDTYYNDNPYFKDKDHYMID